MATTYKVKAKLLIPQAEGKVPSSVKADIGDIIELDGDEPIDVPLLIRVGAIEAVKLTKKKSKRES
tara:strand:+ start:321 stop:518 length:198 start_codon:yes stop_codon:yes gene_type:complete